MYAGKILVPSMSCQCDTHVPAVQCMIQCPVSLPTSVDSANVNHLDLDHLNLLDLCLVDISTFLDPV